MVNEMNTKKCRTAAAVILLTVICLFGSNTAQAKTQKVSGTARYDYAFQVLKLVNQERAKVGAKKLEMDEDLLKAAMKRTAETVVSFSHTRPNGRDCFTMDSKIHGENIAWGMGGGNGTPAQVMNSWMHSSGHKKNILNTGYKSIGIGCINTSDGIYWVQNFGTGEAKKVEQKKNVNVKYQVALDESSQTLLLSDSAAGTNNSSNSGNQTGANLFRWTVRVSHQKLTLNWKKIKKVSECQIQVSNKKNFKQKDTYTVKKSKTQKVIRKYNGKKLKTGKTYYVRMRVATKSGTKNVYGPWGNKIKCQMR